MRLGELGPSDPLFPLRSPAAYSLGYMEQTQGSRGHGASPGSGLGVGCKLCSSSIKLRGLSARAQGAGAAHKQFPLVLCLWGFLVPVSPALRDEARRVEVQHRVPVREVLCFSS